MRFAGPPWRKRQATFALSYLTDSDFLRQLLAAKGDHEMFINVMESGSVPKTLHRFMWLVAEGKVDPEAVYAPVQRVGTLRALAVKVRLGEPVRLEFYPESFTKQEVLSYLEKNYSKLFPGYKGKRARRAVAPTTSEARSEIFQLADAGKSLEHIARLTGHPHSLIESALKARRARKSKGE
jgi:hypothetical protein